MQTIKIYNERGFCTHQFNTSLPQFEMETGFHNSTVTIEAPLILDHNGAALYVWPDPLEGLTIEQAKVIEELQQADPELIDKVIDFLDYSDEE